jgi:hypothetical protein
LVDLLGKLEVVLKVVVLDDWMVETLVWQRVALKVD